MEVSIMMYQVLIGCVELQVRIHNRAHLRIHSILKKARPKNENLATLGIMPGITKSLEYRQDYSIFTCFSATYTLIALDCIKSQPINKWNTHCYSHILFGTSYKLMKLGIEIGKKHKIIQRIEIRDEINTNNAI